MSYELSEVSGIEDVADKIVFALNIGYGAFVTLVMSFALLFDIGLALVGMALGLVLILISGMFLKPIKKEGWLYAFIFDIIITAAAAICVNFPINVYLVTFGILVIIIMLVPQMRKPYT